MDDLTRFEKDLRSLARQLDKGKHVKKFMRDEGTKLRKETLSEAKRKVKKKTGNLYKGIKRGKAYENDGEIKVRVYGSTPKGKTKNDKDIAPHIHLINNGHIIKDKNGNEHGFKEGVHFFESALDNFDDTYVKDTEDFIDDMLKEHDL